MAKLQVEVWIEGTTSMLCNRATEEALSGRTRTNTPTGDDDPREGCNKLVYRLPDKQLAFPGAAVARMLREAGGGEPRPWAEIYWPDPVLSITQFNNSTTDERVLELLEEVIAEQDPPKVPKPEGEQENAEPDQFEGPEEPDDPADDEGEPEAMKMRELEYA